MQTNDEQRTSHSSDRDLENLDYLHPNPFLSSTLKSPVKPPLESHLFQSPDPKAPQDLSLDQPVKYRKEPKGKPWTQEEDELLRSAAGLYFCKNWKAIARLVPGRTHSQCSQRWRRIQPYKMRQPWTKDEDKRLAELVNKYGQNWSLISSSIDGRTGKQVRERWLNRLNPAIDRSRFSAGEDQRIIEMYQLLGPKWKEISKELTGRTENMVKNRFYSSIKKQIMVKNPELYKKLFEESEEKPKIEVKREIEQVFANCVEEDKELELKKAPSLKKTGEFREQKVDDPALERLSFLSRKKEVLEGLLVRVMGQIHDHQFQKPDL